MTRKIAMPLLLTIVAAFAIQPAAYSLYNPAMGGDLNIVAIAGSTAGGLSGESQ